MAISLEVGDQGVSDCAFASCVASNIEVGSGALQVSPNLEGLGNSDMHTVLGDNRQSSVVGLQRSHSGWHVSHGFGREVWKHKFWYV